jgi:transcriptional regulator with XRE-family HTH domain
MGWPTQRGFADACRINRIYMGEVERGESNVSLAKIVVIARKLKITIANLFDGIA